MKWWVVILMVAVVGLIVWFVVNKPKKITLPTHSLESKMGYFETLELEGRV